MKTYDDKRVKGGGWRKPHDDNFVLLAVTNYLYLSTKILSMPLSLNEIRNQAATFSKEWIHEASEDAEAKSFWEFRSMGYRKVELFP